jgi:hypothetical protein
MPEIVTYIDEKANDIKYFDLIANVMWRRANYLLQDRFKKNLNEQILVLDPCAGGGKLMTEMNKTYIGKGYEPNYSRYYYAENLFNQNYGGVSYAVNIINQPFEFHFTLPYLPEYHLAISIPYTDRDINASMETCKECRKFKNYAYYVMSRSLDCLQQGGVGVFAIPIKLMDKEKFEYEIEHITSKSSIISIEEFKDYAIIVLQKN